MPTPAPRQSCAARSALTQPRAPQQTAQRPVWRTPSVVDIRTGMEINSYASAE